MDEFKPLYKRDRKGSFSEVKQNVFDLRCGLTETEFGEYHLHFNSEQKYWSIDELPGARLYPNFLNETQQKSIVTECLAKYTLDAVHLTNLDPFYELQRPINLFKNGDTEASVLPTKPNGSSVLVRDKIRWITLGGQYDWTRKVYPSFVPGTEGCPLFPEGTAKNVAIGANIKPEAAIINFYKQGDILSPHQDVAELSTNDLLSMSFGCACVFYLASKRHDTAPLPLLLQSGDAVVMGGNSRAAWHGVGRVFSGTSPDYLTELDLGEDYELWMKNHRINMNIRQMR